MGTGTGLPVSPSTRLYPGAEWVPVPASLPDTLARHCLLVFTGRVRLARNLLQTVVRNWYAREPRLVATFKRLVETARQMGAALADGACSEWDEGVVGAWLRGTQAMLDDISDCICLLRV